MKQTSHLYLLDPGQRELMILELCWVCANLLNLKVLLLPKHPKLDALLLQLLSHGLREACRVILGNLHAIKTRTCVKYPEGLSNTQQLEQFGCVPVISPMPDSTCEATCEQGSIAAAQQSMYRLAKPVQVTCIPPGAWDPISG